MKIEIFATEFDPWHWAKAYQEEINLTGKFGATTVFIGTMRDMNEGDHVESMWLEHYAGMTEKHLEKIANQAIAHYGLHDVAIAHRIGEIKPNDSIVCVVVWSSHRKEAYEANRMIMEDLKSQAPFWKKEQIEKGDRWVEKNTPG